MREVLLFHITLVWGVYRCIIPRWQVMTSWNPAHSHISDRDFKVSTEKLSTFSRWKWNSLLVSNSSQTLFCLRFEAQIKPHFWGEGDFNHSAANSAVTQSCHFFRLYSQLLAPGITHCTVIKCNPLTLNTTYYCDIDVLVYRAVYGWHRFVGLQRTEHRPCSLHKKPMGFLNWIIDSHQK